jgi:hypothetical protein
MQATSTKTLSVTLCTPGVRTVLAAAWRECWFDEDAREGHGVLPVVALRSVVRQEHGCYRLGDALSGKEGMVQEVVDGLVALHPEYGLVVFEEVRGHVDTPTFRGRLVVCPWPPEEDNRRLAPVLEELILSWPVRDEARRHGGP